MACCWYFQPDLQAKPLGLTPEVRAPIFPWYHRITASCLKFTLAALDKCEPWSYLLPV